MQTTIQTTRRATGIFWRFVLLTGLLTVFSLPTLAQTRYVDDEGKLRTSPVTATALDRLGVPGGSTSTPGPRLAKYHQDHFHIYLRPPTLVEIGGNSPPLNLQAAVPSDATQGLLEETVNTTLPEEIAMLESLILAYQNLPTEFAQRPAIVQTVEQRSVGKEDYDYWLKGYCDVVEPEGFDPQSGVPLQTALNVFPGVVIQLYQESRRGPGITLDDLSEAKVSILEMPRHGQLLPTSATDGALLGGPGYEYKPTLGYLGEDSLTALVEYKGQRIKVTMELVVVGEMRIDNYHFSDGNSGGGLALDRKANDCLFKSRIRRINMAPGGTGQSLNDSTGDYQSWLYTAQLSALLSSSTTALTGFSDLPGSAIAQTTGYYSSGQITLDSNAAGWGWYIDPTPLDNTDDYLPTADPNIWNANPNGSKDVGVRYASPQPTALPDAAPLPMYETPSVQVATVPQAQTSKSTSASAIRRMNYGVCQLTFDYDYARSQGEGIALGLLSYMTDFLSASMQEKLSAEGGGAYYQSEWEWFWEWEESLKITVLRAPSNGTIIVMEDRGDATYLPNKGYIGKDRVDLLVEGKDDSGRPIALTLRYYINVLNNKDYAKIFNLDGENEGAYAKALQKYCGVSKKYWRISEVDGAGDLATLITTAASAFVGFTDLPGSAIAQTTGYYSSGQITLDSNAAGWGWYIDPTPLDNTDDYLPTADPNIWKANPNGSKDVGVRYASPQPTALTKTSRRHCRPWASRRLAHKAIRIVSA
ncbi:MAG: hypothetical protein FWG81_01725 [Betaproteobacteria bacterium]|nr:hypothetical protein [Betaproteobacteria bacterium]